MRELNKLIKGKVRFNEDMSCHTTFKIGGKMAIWAEPRDLEDLRKILKFGKKNKKQVYVIGGGSNILIKEGRMNGIAVHLRAPFFNNINIEEDTIVAGGGVSLRRLLNICADKGLRGLEFCSSIPGTLGGAIAMNAGFGPKSPGSNIGNFVNSVTVMDKNGRVNTIKRKNLRFGYRTSSTNHFIILEAELGLQKADKSYVKKLCRVILEKKKKMQDIYKPSAGCVFKNPYNGFISAGKLIDLSGLKGKRIGDAKVSERNANYIINLGSAHFKDVRKLINLIKDKVKEEFNVELELEIKIWE